MKKQKNFNKIITSSTWSLFALVTTFLIVLGVVMLSNRYYFVDVTLFIVLLYDLFILLLVKFFVLLLRVLYRNMPLSFLLAFEHAGCMAWYFWDQYTAWWCRVLFILFYPVVLLVFFLFLLTRGNETVMYILIRLGLGIFSSIHLTDIFIDILSWYDIESLVERENNMVYAGFGNFTFLTPFYDRSLSLLHQAFTFRPAGGLPDLGYLRISNQQFEDANLVNWGKYSVDFLKPIRNSGSSVVLDPAKGLEILHVNVCF